jgi:hypothetical protein
LEFELKGESKILAHCYFFNLISKLQLPEITSSDEIRQPDISDKAETIQTGFGSM